MIFDHASHSVKLSNQQSSFLWKNLLYKFFRSGQPSEFQQYINEPKTFFSHPTLPDKFVRELNKETCYEISHIEIRGKEISIKYLKDRFSYFDETTFDRSYLGRLIFYIEPEHAENIKPFFLKMSGSTGEKYFPPALKYLEGIWISFNRNLEMGGVAWCFYKFQKMGAEMEVYREGYLSERLYKGVAHLQEDNGGYIFELTGQRYHRMKFVLANSKRITPEILRCISSDFGRNNGGQVIIKELLVRLPYGKADIELTEGSILNDRSVKYELNKYFDEATTGIILDELEDYLGHNENPTYSFDDLLNIKRNHLETIREESKKPPHIEQLGIYVHFKNLGKNTTPYTRSIVKYGRKNMAMPETAYTRDYLVKDEYTYFKTVKYNKVAHQHYKAEYRAESEHGAVDMQCLFPFVTTDANSDAGFPFPNYSHRIMESSSDLFVTSTQFLNEFSQTQNLFIHFEDFTAKTEMVIDFGSVSDFDKLNLQVKSIHYCYISPYEPGSGVIEYKPLKNSSRGFSLLKVDKSKKMLHVSEELVLDKENPKVFNLSINFGTAKGESVYINFNCDNQYL
jgi:hypothetical protein